MLRRLLIPCVFVFALVVPAFSQAQTVEVPELVTDRPDFTESSEVIGKGGFQFESGLSFEADGHDQDRARAFSAPAALMRIGLGYRTELRLGGEGMLSEVVGDVRTS